MAKDSEVNEATVFSVLPQHQPGKAPLAPMSGTLAERVEGFEREQVLRELKAHQFHMTNAARALGLERSHLYKKCQQLGIDVRAARKEE